MKKASISNRIRAICTHRGENARKVAQIQKADYCTTDFREIIADEKIDVVVIATRHDSHAEIATQALRAKKHVFIEKPMAIDESSFERLRKEIEKATTVVTVGFNRRYAPLATKIAELLQNRTAPIQILYRVNPGIIKPTHWTQKRSVGGGRIIGEACHFIDLLKFLVSSEIISVSAIGLNLSRNANYPSDNFSANFAFKDGSIATLIYSSLANNLSGKEYIEIYNDGTTYELKDFKNLSVVKTSREETALKTVDKGWAVEMEQFLKAVRGQENSLMRIEDAIDVTEKTFIIDRMVNANA
jgi:predicted dehydrogenase